MSVVFENCVLLGVIRHNTVKSSYLSCLSYKLSLKTHTQTQIVFDVKFKLESAAASFS